MKRLNTSSIGVTQGSRVLFSDYVNDGPMWAGQGDREIRSCITFPEAYAKPPSVHVSVGMWDMDHKTNIRTDISTEEITTESFVVVFRTWGDTRIARVRVDWMAIGALPCEDDWQLY